MFVVLYTFQGTKVIPFFDKSKYFLTFLTKFLTNIMNGQTIKEFMKRKGVTMDALAARLGTRKQNISSALMNDDIRTGLMEEVAEMIGVSPAVFYTGESSGTAVVSTANQSTVIGKQEGSTRALERQLEVKDDQIDRLLKIIENLNGI